MWTLTSNTKLKPTSGQRKIKLTKEEQNIMDGTKEPLLQLQKLVCHASSLRTKKALIPINGFSQAFFKAVVREPLQNLLCLLDG